MEKANWRVAPQRMLEDASSTLLVIVLTWVSFEISVYKSLMVTVDGSCYTRPGLSNAESTRDIVAFYNFSLGRKYVFI